MKGRVMRYVYQYLYVMIIVLSAAITAHAVEGKEVDWQAHIPDTLEDWVPWVLKDYENPNVCPFMYNRFKRKFCTWSSGLSLSFNEKEGRFSQAIFVTKEAWVVLPGKAELWPQEVKVNQKHAVVVKKNNLPMLWLPAGEHHIKGRFTWNSLPSSMTLPKHAGLVQLTLHDALVSFPHINEHGQLWLKEVATQSEADHLDVNIYRKISDTIPAFIQTRMVLNVAGKHREVTLPSPLLAGSTPIALESTLPVRMDAEHRLWLQVRPGRWVVDIRTYLPQPLEQITLASTVSPLPQEELWAFEAQSALRVVHVEGAAQLDPTQTDMPTDWQRLPTYRLTAGDQLNIIEKQRGETSLYKDDLALMRHLWLDFDGSGYTVKDRITGDIHQRSRLEVRDDFRLGNVTIHGKGQVITRLAEGKNAGVEVREGNIVLEAQGRIEEASVPLNAVGWVTDINRLSTTLHLPPGWSAFHIAGADKVHQTWVGQWTLLTVFLVLVTVVAIYRLMGWKVAIIALPTLILVEPEIAIAAEILVILIAMALLRVLKEGKLQKVVLWGKHIMVITFVLSVVFFMITHIRGAIYPQLERLSYEHNQQNMYSIMRDTKIRKSALPEAMMSADVASLEKGASNAQYIYDPSHKVQTGYGVSDWRGNAILLSWNGPVSSDSSLTMMLVSPSMHVIAAVIRVILLLMLSAWIIMPRWAEKLRRVSASKRNHIAALCLGMLIGGSIITTSQAYASDTVFPPAPLLQEMRQYIVKEHEKKPECLPHCVHIPTLQIKAMHDDIRLDFTMHAKETVAVPLPHSKDWFIHDILLEGKREGVRLQKDRTHTWIELSEGVHQLSVLARLREANTVTMHFPLVPAYTSTATKGWKLFGVDAQGSIESSVKLVPIHQKKDRKNIVNKEQSLPPLLQVERRIELAHRWTVHTTIRRLSPPETPIVMDIPLLTGESVTTAGVNVSQGKVQLTMKPGQSAIHWSSVLDSEVASAIHLTAPSDVPWVEIWKLHTTNLWHVDYDGTPRIYPQIMPAGHVIPEWRPRAGETLTIHIAKPQGVEGPTKTIQKAVLSFDVGQRVMQSTLALTMHASLGGMHDIVLPEAVESVAVKVDGVAKSVEMKERILTLPIRPGTQEVMITWKQDISQEITFHTPEINLNMPSVNIETRITFPQSRWVLWVSRHLVGPAVLFWGIVPVLILLALLLGKLPYTPLSVWHWLLLLIGTSQIHWVGNMFIIGWFIAMGVRGHYAPSTSKRVLFASKQVALALWTLVAIMVLIATIKHGLLGSPDMHITGNGSTNYVFTWYHDMSDNMLPTLSVISLHTLFYRGAMLLWALWLAFSCTKWLHWGWKCYSNGGYWLPPKQ